MHTSRLLAGIRKLAIVAILLETGCSKSLHEPLPPPTTIDLFAEQGRLVGQTWDAHYVRGAKVGHRQTSIYEIGDEDRPRRKIVAIDRLEIRRFGQISRQQLKSISLEDCSGQVLQLAYEIQAGESIQRARGIIQGQQLELTSQVQRRTQSSRYAWSKDNGGFFAVENSLRQQPMRPGQLRTVKSFLPLIDGSTTIKLNAVRVEPVRLLDSTRDLLRIEATDKLAEGWQISTTYWTDEAGTILKSAEGFLDRETIRVDQALATRTNDIVQIDLGLDVGVELDKEIDDPHSTRYAVYRVQTTGFDPKQVFAESASQKILSTDDQFAVVTVEQIDLDVAASPVENAREPTTADLQPNRLIQSDDARVLAIANAAAGSLDDPWRAAKALEQYLYRRLGKVDVSQIFSSAAEVAAQRKGDCSEHAVLLAATCRARGIPARVAVGLVYSQEVNKFLYHMWTEVWIKWRWVPLDATLGKGGIGAAHLKLRDSNLARESPYSMVSPVIHLIDKLKIELVDVSYE